MSCAGASVKVSQVDLIICAVIVKYEIIPRSCVRFVQYLTSNDHLVEAQLRAPQLFMRLS